MGEARNPVLEASGLRTVFRTRDLTVHAVNDVGFSVRSGEILGVVGESGSGKSVTMMSLMRLLPCPPAEIVSGKAMLGDCDLLGLPLAELRKLCGAKIGFVFQDPMTSLNPVFTVGWQIMEPLRKHLGMSRRAARKRAEELLDLVGIASPRKRLDDYPHQFSGGMRQRAMIAMALACDPEVLIADEPTTALDVTIQAQILELIEKLRAELGMAIIWITHDLAVVAEIADRVMVMYGGQVVERASTEELFANPKHPYTSMLLETLPGAATRRGGKLRSIAGQPPLLTEPLNHCPFAPRCPEASRRCRESNPPLASAGEAHEAACWLTQESIQ